jgi:hypothetical protein
MTLMPAVPASPLPVAAPEVMLPPVMDAPASPTSSSPMMPTVAASAVVELASPEAMVAPSALTLAPAPRAMPA